MKHCLLSSNWLQLVEAVFSQSYLSLVNHFIEGAYISHVPNCLFVISLCHIEPTVIYSTVVTIILIATATENLRVPGN